MPVEIRVPQLGESVVEATVIKWLKKEGDHVSAGEAVVELETDKVNVEVPSDESGILGNIAHAEGATVAVGDLLASVTEGADSGAMSPAATNGQSATPAMAPDSPATALTDGDTIVSPVAKRIANDNAVNLADVKGSGPNGRIMKGDVAGEIERKLNQTAPVRDVAAQPSVSANPQVMPGASVQPTALSRTQNEERIKMTRRRLTIATRLVEAQRTAAMLTTFNEIDMTAVMDVRKRRKDAFKEKNGVNLGFMSFFVKATVGALKAFPYLNAEIQADEIVLKKYYDIGVAVSTDEGLVVPVLRAAGTKSFAGIEQSIVDLATRSRQSKLTLNELQGGTFTITNGGVFGSLMSTPILNTPQVGILGLHKIQERPIAENGQVVIRPMMYVALSYDHRIVDGSEAVRFLVKVKELIEDPESLLLEG